MTQTETTHTEMWTYIGKRISTKHKPIDVWLDESGETRLFDKVKGDSPGARYTVTLDDSGALFTGGANSPRYVDMHPDVDLRAEWAAEERIALVHHESQQRAKRESSNELSTLCAPLRDMMRKQIGHTRRAALLAAIIEEVQS